MDLIRDVGPSQKNDGYLTYNDARNAENGTTERAQSKDIHRKAKAAYYQT